MFIQVFGYKGMFGTYIYHMAFRWGDITLCIKIDKPLMIYRFLAMVRNDAHNDVKYI